MIEHLQRAVKLAAKYREASWNPEEEAYAMTLRQAADKAAEEVGFDTRGTTPVYLLLHTAWNDALSWAEGDK